MSPKPSERKQEILEAALVELIEKGRSGARLQSMADNIGVTKAMIHYYFNTKEELCDAVFREACHRLIDTLFDTLETDAPLFQKIEKFINAAIERFSGQSALLQFVIHELNSSPQSTTEIMLTLSDYDDSVLGQQLQEASSNYEIAPVESEQLLTNILSLCMFPFIAQDFIKALFGMDNEAHDQFLARRKDIVADTIINWLAS